MALSARAACAAFLGLVACGGDGASASSSAGSGGIGGGTLTSGGGGTPGGSSGMGGSSASNLAAHCAQGCSNARACLTTGELCPDVTAADGDAIEAGCLELCAASAELLEAISENATRCGLALSVLTENAELASRPNRDVIERCAPSEACHAACETVGSCAGNECENRGANSGNIYGWCVPRCAADESWAADIETARQSSCTAVLTRYAEEAPGDLPAGCPPP